MTRSCARTAATPSASSARTNCRLRSRARDAVINGRQALLNVICPY